MPRPLPSDPAAHARARRMAVTGTWLAALGWAYLVACLIKAGVEQNPAGALVFLTTGITTPLLVVLVASLWRRERAARARWFEAGASRGERCGVPELDAPAGPHRSLNSDAEPPRRW